MSGRVLPFDPPTHKVVDVLLPWFVNGTLEADELAFVQQHLGECLRCRREVEWLRELRAACADGEAAPAASTVFRKLRRQLDAPRPERAEAAGQRGLRSRAPHWSRWTMAAELAVIIALATALLATGDGPTLYRTLGARNAPTTGTLVVIFDPSTTESNLRRILREAGVRIADGPTQANAYVLSVATERQGEAVRSLRAESAIVLVEQLNSGEVR